MQQPQQKQKLEGQSVRRNIGSRGPAKYTAWMHWMNDAVRQLREQTLDYMSRLVERRKADSMRTEKEGKRDSGSIARGQSALDSAMAQAQDMISSLDRILEQREPDVQTFRTSCNGLSRLKPSRFAS